jgi:hypothetical protein
MYNYGYRDYAPAVAQFSLDVVTGAIGIAVSVGTTGLSSGTASSAVSTLFIESIVAAGYGIAEIVNGFTGEATLPPVTDLLIEQASLGFAKTGFDSMYDWQKDDHEMETNQKNTQVQKDNKGD